MGVNYNVVLSSVLGVDIGEAYPLVSLQAARSFNTIGSLTMRVKDDHFPPWFWRKNMRLKVYRSSDNGPYALLGNTVWLLKSALWLYSEGEWEITAKDTLSIVDGPLVAYTQDTIYADKTFENGNQDTPENLMRIYVSENMGVDALDTERDRSDYLDVEALHGFGGAETGKTASYQELFSVLTSLASDSEAAGFPLIMDVVPVADERFEFRVRKEYLGSDRTTGEGKISFSSNLNNLTDVQMLWDYSIEATVAIVGGIGDGAGRFITTVKNDVRINDNPFNRVERFVDMSDELDESVLETEGGIFLQKNSSKLIVTAQVVDVPGLRFGKDYFYGDKVTVTAGSYEIPCVLNAFSTSWSGGEEQLDLRLKGELAV